MLYRTHHPFFFPFNPFISISPHPHPHPSTTPLSSSPSIQVEQEMECVEGALKSSFRPEMAVAKPTQQPVFDDLWTVNDKIGVSGDDFFVDNLLDFSKDGLVEEEEEEQQKVFNNGGSVSLAISQAENGNNSNPNSYGSLPESELCVPADELADLEWLSNFVDDSFTGYSLTYPAGKSSEKPSENLPEPEVPAFTTPFQTKARSKRARNGGRVWSLGSPSLTESSTSSSSSSTCTSSSWLIQVHPNHTAESQLGKPPGPPASAKKQRKRAAIEKSGSGGGGAPQPRRCSHCLVQKTPQWRTGPLGAKTLCNACGVRYKSGRLLPEYRPACSPTFSSEVHSNNHRKVLEMRRKKEGEVGLAHPAQSF